MEEECKLEANGLKMIKLGLCAEQVHDIDRDGLNAALRHRFAGKGYVVAWLDYKVLIGTWEEGAFHFYQDEQFERRFVQQLRVFDEQNEFLVWRSRGGLKGRLRTDDHSGAGRLAVVAHQALYGTNSEQLNGRFTQISETRGTRLILPFTSIDLKQGPVCIKTHNYLTFNAVHQATYSDCRFVAFTDGQAPLS